MRNKKQTINTSKVKAPNIVGPLKRTPEQTEEIKEKLHKQPRNLLKTSARIVGKTTDDITFFSLPESNENKDVNLIKQTISKKTSILAHYLIELYQANGEKELVINNLSPLSEKMNTTNFEMKIYFLYLGGYTYPIADTDENGELTLSMELLFKIDFKYSKQVAEKYKNEKYTHIGNTTLHFIKDEPVDRIIIKPNERFIKSLEQREKGEKRKDLGNVLVVNDEYMKLSLSLTDIAYKILTFSASNKPKQRLREDNLIRPLGLEKQVRTQGKPRVRATILKGFQELQDKGHIEQYSFDETNELYIFSYSNKYVKHSAGIEHEKAE